MKQYFAKYLPVEGGKKFFFTNANNSEYLIASEGLHNVTIEEKKLFLCSRDPNRISSVKILKGEIPTEVDILAWKEKDKDYKVIGEISPEAVWVKESIEFDKEDIKFFNNFNNEELDLRGYEIVKHLKGQVNIKIKCPCCNKFA